MKKTKEIPTVPCYVLVRLLSATVIVFSGSTTFFSGMTFFPKIVSTRNHRAHCGFLSHLSLIWWSGSRWEPSYSESNSNDLQMTRHLMIRKRSLLLGYEDCKYAFLILVKVSNNISFLF